MSDAKDSIYVGRLEPNFDIESLKGMHGLHLGHVEQTFKEGSFDPVEQANVIKEMREFMDQYFEGWTVTVRAVS